MGKLKIKYTKTDHVPYSVCVFVYLHLYTKTGCINLLMGAIMFLTLCVCVSVKRLSARWAGG